MKQKILIVQPIHERGVQIFDERFEVRTASDWAGKGNKITAAVSTAAGAVDRVMRAISKRTGVPITTVPFTGGADAVAALADYSFLRSAWAAT
jgi:tripartite-type tricarboxylate transporter receptor subunit TctC